MADFEIEIVGDDSSGTEISSIVDRVMLYHHTIKYHKNAHRLGELENLARIKRSSGMFTKPLSDDDFLLESCVQSQAERSTQPIGCFRHFA